MIRRNIRLRKEYLFNKGKELKDREQQDNLMKIKKAVENDKRMPTEMRKNKD